MKSALRLLLCALALLSGSVLWAVTEVTLNASATPSAADPDVTNVTVVGHGFPSGTIPPANVIVRLNPATSGGGPSGTTTATKVTVESGATEAVTFKVPTSITVSAGTSYQVSIAGTTSTGNAFASSNTASLTVNAPVAITTSSPLPTGTVNVSYSRTLTATGGSGTYTWAVATGTLPGGLSLNITTGVISGLPTARGLSHFEIKVTDSLHRPAAREFAVTIDPALTITTSSPLPTGTVGVNYAQTLTATGGSGTYTWSVTVGALPGLSLNSATGAISGQPTTAGPANFTIQVTDSNQATATRAFAMTVNPALVITSGSPLPQGTAGVNYAQTLTATGGSGTYTWSVTVGNLPSPLLLNAATGLISGQPGAATTANFTIQVTDTNQVVSTKAFALTINPALVITTSSPLPQGTVGVNYSQTLAATGGSGTYTWAVTAGSLPSPLLLNAATGAITGQPASAGPANFTIQVTDSNQATATKAFALTVNPALVITTSSPLPEATAGVNYSQTVAATGGSGTYTWAVSVGSLPNPLTLNPTTGLISGQPSAATTANFTIQVTDTNQVTATKAFALTVNPALVITSSPLPTGTVGVNYSQTLAATGGSGSYTWAVSVGSLPNPLLLNPATGLISGQPGTATTANFTIQVTDTNQVVVTKAFALTINPALLITTTSPLPAATPTVAYSQTFAASGGAGGYSWSATSLPAWLGMSTAGALTGTPPLTAVDSTFTVTVTDSLNVATSGSFTVPVTLAITTTSPLPTGHVGVNYSQSLTATGGTGQYTWSVTTGTLPAGLTLTPASGLISGQPTTATGGSFTTQVQDSNQVTAFVPFTLTINPAASIQTLTPNSSNAGLSLQVSITGSFTHFAQGTTVANFGPGIAVGGGTAGQPGPVTVISATSATAQIAISASAATGSQTVTMTTGAEQASLANGFTIQAAIPYISVTATTTTPLATRFSGFNDEYLLDGVEYWDPKWLAAVMPLHPGWIRFPGGTPSMAFDWETAHENTTWMSELEPHIPAAFGPGLLTAQEMTQAKGGACFARGPCVSDYATFLKTLGANGTVAVNGYTDSNPDSVGVMAAAAQVAGINIIEWEIDNEPYDFPGIFPTAASYAASAYSPSYLQLHATKPSATVGVFFQGEFLTLVGNYQTWDSGMAAYSPQYWQGVSFHVYPITNPSMAVSDEEQTLNGILAHGTTEYYGSYIQPLVGQNTPVFFSEINSDGFAASGPFESYIYNGIFLAEWVARMSTVPQVQAVGISALLLPNSFSQGMICAVNDYEDYLMAQVVANPNYSTDTSTNPITQYQFYYSTSGLAMEVANLAINSSNATWPTTVTGGPTVPIEGYDGNPVPAVFAQGYQGTDGTHYLLITNKSSSSVRIAIEVNGDVLQSTLTVSYISNASDTAQNTATAQANVQIVNTTSPNPITVGPYSVTRVQW